MNVFNLVSVILNFLTLAVACAVGFFCLGQPECYKCDNTYLYIQYLDITVYGLLLLIFFVCISIMAKENIPFKMQLTISFLSAFMYAVATTLVAALVSSDGYGKVAYTQLALLAVLTLLHLSTGVLYLLKEKLFNETD